MQSQYYPIETFPQSLVMRQDHPDTKQSAYFQIRRQNFAFTHYDHGTPQLKQQYGITHKLFRYFNKRNFLFSRFEQGIAIDQQSWYSVIPQPVSLFLRSRFANCKIGKIFQPFCGVGGIAVHLCDHFQQYVVNDIDPSKIRMLQHNLGVYGKTLQRSNIFNQDFLQIQPFKTDALIICPPWGGIDTNAYAHQEVDKLMKPSLTDILTHAIKFSQNIMLQMPKQTNLVSLLKVVHSIGLKPVITVQKIMTNNKCSQLFFYFGRQSFTSINGLQLYTVLYRDLQIVSKADKKKAKEMLQTKPCLLMKEVYKAKHPNTITIFTD